MPTDLETLQYPLGRYTYPANTTASQHAEWIATIAQIPTDLRRALDDLTPDQLDTPYRPGGWTVRQVVHHLPDSHMNSFIRYKLGLTESVPTVKPYDEASWALLPDAHETPIEVSLTLLETLHTRWMYLLEAATEADLARQINHPDSGTMTLATYLGLVAWHGRHHIAHITNLRSRMGW